MAAKLQRRYSTDIRATLISFEVGEGKLIPYNDVVENGVVINEGSLTNTNTWSTRCAALKRNENLPGNFMFRTIKAPYPGTYISRIS